MEIEGLRFNEARWGHISGYTTPAPHVYYVDTDKDFIIAIPKKTAASIISEKAISLAHKDRNFLYYEYYQNGTAVRHELILKTLESCDDPAQKASLTEELNEIDLFGRIEIPQYFGECIPPKETPSGAVTNFVRLENGIFLVRASSDHFLAVHIINLDNQLTIPTHRMAKIIGTYAFFDTCSCAPAFHELVYSSVSIDKKSIKKYVCSWDDLYSAINKYFNNYMVQYNRVRPKFTKPIPVIIKRTDRDFIDWSSLDSQEEIIQDA